MQNNEKQVFSNKKQVILAFAKPKFKMQLYMESNVKGKNYLTNQIFFSM